MAESLFRINPKLPQITAKIQQRVDRAVERIWVALQRWSQEWSRRAARVTPVETGALRRNYFVIPMRQGTKLTVILANHLEYGKWLEFGTKFIAGGSVEQWRRGQPPIMMWPAKQRDLQGASAAIRQKAMGIGAGEQMPMVRATGYELLPQIIAEVQKIVREELGRAA